LSIRALDDDRVLLRCFAECATEEVLSAIGLDFAALFPERQIEHAPRERVPFAPLDVLRACAYEALIASVAASNIARCVPLTDVDCARLWTAAARLQRAVEACDGS
jgi:hypothetical protein